MSPIAPTGSNLMGVPKMETLSKGSFNPSLPTPAPRGERVGYILIYILDPNYVFTPPETPAKCPQQQVSTPNIASGNCLHVFT